MSSAPGSTPEVDVEVGEPPVPHPHLSHGFQRSPGPLWHRTRGESYTDLESLAATATRQDSILSILRHSVPWTEETLVSPDPNP